MYGVYVCGVCMCVVWCVYECVCVCVCVKLGTSHDRKKHKAESVQEQSTEEDKWE